MPERVFKYISSLKNKVVVPIKWMKFWELNRLCVTFSGRWGCESKELHNITFDTK